MLFYQTQDGRFAARRECRRSASALREWSTVERRRLAGAQSERCRTATHQNVACSPLSGSTLPLSSMFAARLGQEFLSQVFLGASRHHGTFRRINRLAIDRDVGRSVEPCGFVGSAITAKRQDLRPILSLMRLFVSLGNHSFPDSVDAIR